MIHTVFPHTTEKAYSLSQEKNIYVFKADKRLNKNQIKDMIQTEYKVKVLALRVALVKGKMARSFSLRRRRRRQPIYGRRQTWKKVYVTLSKGDTIAAFTDASKDKQKAG